MKESKSALVKDAFGSLFSNDKAISVSKRAPIWLTILIFFLAIIIPVVPLTISASSSYGASFINSNSVCFEKTMPKLALEMAKDNVNFLTVNEEHELSITTNSETAAYKYVNQNTNRVEMEIFFSASTDSKARQAYINSYADHKYELAEVDGEMTYYHSSYTVFFNNAVYCCIYKTDSLDVIAYSSFGDFKSFAPGTNLVELLTTVDGNKLAPTTAVEINTLLADSNTNTAIMNNWKTIFNKAYISSRNTNTLMGSLIYLGVYTALSLIMSFLIWIMTRGKNNPFSYLSLLACFKIESWASLAPGLIALILGLFLTQYAMMIFIMCLGMRIMWISMRQLRPQVQ